MGAAGAVLRANPHAETDSVTTARSKVRLIARLRNKAGRPCWPPQDRKARAPRTAASGSSLLGCGLGLGGALRQVLEQLLRRDGLACAVVRETGTRRDEPPDDDV